MKVNLSELPPQYQRGIPESSEEDTQAIREFLREKYPDWDSE